jgi:hypothetical protein
MPRPAEDEAPLVAKPRIYDPGSMPDKQLRAELSHLHEELERASSVDAPSRELLETLSGDIERLLDTSARRDAADSSHESLSERLGEAVRHFEESHPALSVAVGRIATALSNMGI